MDKEDDKWVMPGWMEKYRNEIRNTGGNPVEELMNDKTTSLDNNVIRVILITSVLSQVSLLESLHAKGRL